MMTSRGHETKREYIAPLVTIFDRFEEAILLQCATCWRVTHLKIQASDEYVGSRLA